MRACYFVGMSPRCPVVAAACLLLVAVAGCTRAASLPAMLVASDVDAVFDTVDDAALARRSLTFTNIGTATTPPLSVELHGDVTAFAVDWDSCSGATLKEDGHCDVVVRLDGNAAGVFDGELRVFAMAPLAASVPLHGKVTPARLTLTPPASTTVDATPGQTVSLSYTVHNAGGATSGPLSATSNSSPFWVVGGDCGGVTLAGGADCTLKLIDGVAVDAAVGTSSGTLVMSAAPGGDVDATATLVVHQGPVLSVGNVDFGDVPTLTAPMATVTVTNPGSIESGALAASIVDSEAASRFFVQNDGCAGKSLAQGQSCMVTVGVALTDTRMHMALLDVAGANVSGYGTLTAHGLRAHWTITLSFAGSGSGGVTNQAATYPSGPASDVVMIPNGQASQPFTAMADSGSTFAGWGGTAPCTGTGECAAFTGADNSDLTLTATFTP